MKIKELHSGSTVHLTIDTDDGATLLHTVTDGLTPAQSLRQSADEYRERAERLLRSAKRLEAASAQLEQTDD